MSDYFDSSRRKIARAKKHLADLKTAVAKFFSRPNIYQPFVEAHPKIAGWTILKVRFLKELPPEFEEIAGDVVGNLRSALDHAVYATAVAHAFSNSLPKPKIDTACFPFSRIEANFEKALNGRCASVPLELHSIFRECKPYSGGNEPLWALNCIRGTDEHAILIPAVTAVFVGGMQVRVAGRFVMPDRPILNRSKHEIDVCSMAPGTKFHGDFQLASYVSLGEVGSLAGKNAIEVFDLFVELVTTIVDKIESESKRLGIVR